VDRQAFLDYRDSGMAGTASNDDPRSFHSAHLGEAAGRLAVIMREERPDVVVTYTPDGTYGHPDHVKAHHTTIAALDLLQEEGWSPAKAYLQAVPRSFVEQMRERFREMAQEGDGIPSRIMGVPDEEITTIVDVRDLVARKRASFAAHVSQNDPNSPFATMAEQIFVAAFGTERFVLARGTLGEPRPEHDLFVGVG